MSILKEEGIKILLPMIWRFTTIRATSEGNSTFTGWDWELAAQYINILKG